MYYTGSGVEEEDTWILVKWLRPDWNYFISVCSPRSGSEYDPSGIEFRDALANSGVLDWKNHSFVSPTDKLSSKALLNVYVDNVELIWTLHSCQQFYMKLEDMLLLEATPKDPNVRLGPLTVETGTDFIVNNWHFGHISTREKVCEAVRKIIEKSITCGVYVKDENCQETLASGGVLTGGGEVGMLYTDVAHRRKGYAALLIRHMFKEMAKCGLHGCIQGELHNNAAVKLYSGIPGLGPVHKFTLICCEHAT